MAVSIDELSWENPDEFGWENPDNEEYVFIDKFSWEHPDNEEYVRLKFLSLGDKHFSTGMSITRGYTNH